MPANLPILSLIAFSPLLGILVLLFIPKHKGQWIKIIGIAATIIPLILAGWLYANFNHQSGVMQFVENHNWITINLNKEVSNLAQFKQFYLSFNYNVGVDGLSLPMIFLTALISTMAALASVYIKKRWKAYFILFLILEVGMFGVFMAQDLFLFFLFFEVALVPVFFLIGIWGYHNREKAANKFLIYNGIGSALMLIAFLIIITTAGFVYVDAAGGSSIFFSGSVTNISHNLFENAQAFVNQTPVDNPNPFYLSAALKWTVFILLLVAFAIKLPIFPFHTWMLKVHTEAPPSIVMIHSGILLKMGAYGLIRFGVLLFPAEAKHWAFILGLLGLINIIYGAILAFAQKDFKLVLAYSSISHMGIVLLGIAAFNQIGMQGAIFQMVSHGLISALMFLIVGSIYERTETTQLDKLGGLAKSMPFISGILLIAGMASLGLPGLSGFISEFLAFLGLFDSMRVITIISTVGIILTAVYVLRGVLKITFGPMSDLYSGIRDARLIEAIPMIILVAFILLLGVFPSVLSHPIQQTVSGFNDLVLKIIATKMGG
ncbi:MAG: proton-translocating NADH-quinone oxidoreductase subunit [Bacilli bacterium]|nr:proton-translocating NADH-quinone oxidoreductase subunit [Bacilli bacterium]